MILDSNNRREFGSGAVRDIQEGKGRCDLMPLGVVGLVLEDTTLGKIEQFKRTGDYAHLLSALSSCGIYPDKYTMMLEVAKHFEEGAKKYGENNWQKGIPVQCYIDSAVRHYIKYLRGDNDENHNRAFCWNLMTAMWTCKYLPEQNNYLGGGEK